MKKTLILLCGLLVATHALVGDDPAIQEPTVVMKEIDMMGKKMQVPVIVAPHYLPTLKADMTPEQAAEALSLSLPVVVTNTASFEDGGTITWAIVDSK